MVDHDCLHGEALELEISIVKGEGDIDVTQVVVEEYFPHGFGVCESVGVFFEDQLHFGRHIESAGILVVDGPISLGNDQAIQLLE